ncbi:M28 family peptidase [Sphingomonas sp. ID1715]|uniref:M28 family peptidase n=1 Tax=Sphingomonas sp. ID1715 TaxID=1656898 RepID=UPI001487F90C|nr:M28 family peptidase [Sphingomonas sp. ID1715]NNM77658.1 M28 family peptidase [Sphingomonas sp. ID1715]
MRAILLALLLSGTASAQTGGPIRGEAIKAHVRILSADAFHGRGPTQAGEQPTLDYISKQFAAAGLEPAGPNGSWLQDVPLIRFDRSSASASMTVAGRSIALTPGQEITAAPSGEGTAALADVPMVFGGYGVIGQGFDPFDGVDVRGKVVVVLWGDPDVEAGRDLGFGGRAATLAGRTGSKFAPLRARGAAGIVTVHEDFPASYPWSQIANGDRLPSFVLDQGGAVPQAGEARINMRGDVARDLFRRAGLDFDALKRRAQDKGFRSVPIGNARLTASVSATATRVVSHNVVGLFKGTDREQETVLYGAHWDANGENASDPPADRIRNGAIDNGIGTSELIEVAKAYGRAPRPLRSVLFAAWTAEEKGLLGATWYAGHPLRPLETTAVALNLDPHLALDRALNIDLIGPGRTPLEGDLARVAKSQGLRLDPEKNSEAGWYFRSDHYPFAEKGVPTVYFRAGKDLAEGGLKRGEAITNVYNTRCYHQTCDEFDSRWTLNGAAQEANVAYALGREIADSARWPNWNPDTDFAATRAKSNAARH